ELSGFLAFSVFYFIVLQLEVRNVGFTCLFLSNIVGEPAPTLWMGRGGFILPVCFSQILLVNPPLQD
ncbi:MULTISPECIES: hypothetical protein, partial [unclassified Microcoleus]|uniref:hypothetical protein n=1 Tax=unclassified Microcoleus TaxID=2642155 RepID=UPI002FCF642A